MRVKDENIASSRSRDSNYFGSYSNSIRAFLWFGTSAQELGTLGATNNATVALNDLGQVTGISQTIGDSESHAFLWSNGHMYDLGTLDGRSSRPLAINNSGEVTGVASTEDGGLSAFI